MPWVHILIAFVVSILVASFSDWYFFGVLFHDRYAKTPGVWKKYANKNDEMKSIWLAQAFMSITCLVFILVCARMGWTSLRTSVPAAIVLWVMIPLPLLATNAIFIPMDRRIVVSHSLGWLARLLITAICVGLLRVT